MSDRKEAVLSAIGGRWRETFEGMGVRFASDAKGREQKFHCPCGQHQNNDKTASGYLNVENGLWNCMVTGKGGDIFEMVGIIFGLTSFPEKISKIGEVLGIASKNEHRPKKKIIKIYQYMDENETLRFEAVRFEPKSFAQRRSDGKGGQIWDVKGVCLVLYHLPDLKGQQTVYVVEGEKDADLLWEQGIPATCNPMGAGKWRKEYTEQLKAAGVENVVVLPDNDEAGEKHGIEVANSCFKAGLKVKIVRLPGLSDKEDVSDWLDSGGTREKLTSILEDSPIMLAEAPTPEDKQLGEDRPKNEKIAKSEEITEEFQNRGIIHPALHIDEKGIVLGIVTENGQFQLITSNRNRHANPEQLSGILEFAPKPYSVLAGRWPDRNIEEFLDGGKTPSFSDVLALITKELDVAMEFPRKELRSLIAIWILGTYFLAIFLAFPRLSTIAEKESGKSKLLTILGATAFNALLMLNPTPAVLFRLVQAQRATLLLDEMEGLGNDDRKEVLSIINSGYKAGGIVHRVEGQSNREVRPFSVYAPLALAGIKGINATTEDRCIPINLQRGTDRNRINAEVDPASSSFARIRSGCYRLLLTRHDDVRNAYLNVILPEWLNARARELWKPLLALAELADAESEWGLKDYLLALAREHSEDRAGISAEGEALFTVLTERMGTGETIIMRPKDLCEPLRERLGWQRPPSPPLVASWLRRFGFQKAKPPRDKDGVRYIITAGHLQEARLRYLPGEGILSPKTTYIPTPSSDKQLNINDFDRM